ncbi:MAG: hypothetical protein ACR2F8_08410 [Caulobacteraceae bacterium]
MLEFEDFVYLDVQKTGSTMIREFLASFARTEIIYEKKHRPAERRDDDKLYIISCRDPLKQYLSLYLHGHAGKGGLRARLNRAAMGHFYDGTNEGFAAWLDLLLDPVASQKYLKGMDNDRILDFVGLQTLRFLKLAFPAPWSVFETLRDKADVSDRLKTDALYGVILKTESLIDDLKRLATGEHAGLFRDTSEATAFLDADRQKNASTNPGVDLKALSADRIARVQEREWFFFDHLGYPPYVS